MPAGLGSIGAAASQYKVKITYFASIASATKMINADPNRVALILDDQTGNIHFGVAGFQPTNNQGIISCMTSFPTQVLTFEQWGPLVQAEWWECRVSGTSTTGITEIIYSPTG